jgi:expansin (peptidoglycan-binding protein)
MIATVLLSTVWSTIYTGTVTGAATGMVVGAFLLGPMSWYVIKAGRINSS